MDTGQRRPYTKWHEWALALADTFPQAQAPQFVACLEAEEVGVHLTTVAQHQATQHFDLLRLAGEVALEWDVLGQLLDGLPVIPLFLCL